MKAQYILANMNTNDMRILKNYKKALLLWIVLYALASAVGIS